MTYRGFTRMIADQKNTDPYRKRWGLVVERDATLMTLCRPSGAPTICLLTQRYRAGLTHFAPLVLDCIE